MKKVISFCLTVAIVGFAAYTINFLGSSGVVFPVGTPESLTDFYDLISYEDKHEVDKTESCNEIKTCDEAIPEIIAESFRITNFTVVYVYRLYEQMDYRWEHIIDHPDAISPYEAAKIGALYLEELFGATLDGMYMQVFVSNTVPQRYCGIAWYTPRNAAWTGRVINRYSRSGLVAAYYEFSVGMLDGKRLYAARFSDSYPWTSQAWDFVLELGVLDFDYLLESGAVCRNDLNEARRIADFYASRHFSGTEVVDVSLLRLDKHFRAKLRGHTIPVVLHREFGADGSMFITTESFAFEATNCLGASIWMEVRPHEVIPVRFIFVIPSNKYCDCEVFGDSQ